LSGGAGTAGKQLLAAARTELQKYTILFSQAGKSKRLHSGQFTASHIIAVNRLNATVHYTRSLCLQIVPAILRHQKQ
jgi:hypothetical protein